MITLLAMENEQLVLRAQQGDEAARELVLKKNSPLVKYHMNKFARYFPTYAEDLFQEGLIALNNAITEYDPERGQFARIMTTSIRNAMMRYIRDNRKHLNLAMLAIQDSEDMEVEEGIDILSEAMDALTSQEKMIIESNYWGDVSLADIAREMGVTRARVHQIKTAALAKLKKRLNNLDWKRKTENEI